MGTVGIHLQRSFKLDLFHAKGARMGQARDDAMRILQVVPVFSSIFGGPVGVVRSISKELARRHNVTVCTTSALNHHQDFSSSISVEELDGYQTYYFPRALRFIGFTISPSMARVLRDSIANFSLVHLHSLRHFQDLIVHRYATKHSVPYILHPHGSIPLIMEKQRRKRIYDALFGSKLFRDAAKIIALSQTEAKQALRAGVPVEKVGIVPNGIDPSNYEELPPKGEFRAKYRISNTTRIILYLGRIHVTKRIDLLIRAYTHLLKSEKRIKSLLVIAGPDDGDRNHLESLVHSLGIQQSVLFTGFLNNKDKFRALVDAEVFVTPSFYGFPVAFLEACAAGVPIITTTSGDILEWINDVGIVTSVNPSDLARAIHTIISDRKLHRSLSRKCRAIVKSTFSISNVVRRLERIYKEVTAGR